VYQTSDIGEIVTDVVSTRKYIGEA